MSSKPNLSCKQMWLIAQQNALTKHSTSDGFEFMRCVPVQIQEELDNLARQAIANAMNVIKSEKYVFTSNDNYMKLLNKMKAYVMRKKIGNRRPPEVAADNKDVVK